VFVDTVALLELAKWKTSRGDELTHAEQLVPIPLTRTRQPHGARSFRGS
jgi:hypothetical protein